MDVSLGHLRNKLLLHYLLERESIMQLFIQVMKLNWVQQLLAEIEFSSQTATTLCINNTSSIHMIETPDQFTNWTKHINIAYHWIHEEVQKQTMCLLTIIYLISSPKDSMHHVTKNLLVHLEWVLGLMLVEGQC